MDIEKMVVEKLKTFLLLTQQEILRFMEGLEVGDRSKNETQI